MWHFCQYVKQQVLEFAGEDFYKEHGEYIMDILMNNCSEDFEFVRYPEDEEIKLVINEVYK